jgi:hypothetical protein
MTSSHQLPAPCQWFSRLASALDRRSAPRLALQFLGAVLARGRRTVTSWIRAAGLSDQFRPCYTAVAAAGKRSDRIARRVLTEVVEPLVATVGRLTLALDDTPTERTRCTSTSGWMKPVNIPTVNARRKPGVGITLSGIMKKA